MMGWYGHGWGMGFGWIFGLAFLVLFIWVIVRSANQNQHPNTGIENRNKALDILKERYARGEIDKNEFEEKKKDLM